VVSSPLYERLRGDPGVRGVGAPDLEERMTVTLDAGEITVAGQNPLALPDVAWQAFPVAFDQGQVFEVELTADQSFAVEA
jgi:hypothetical protein